MKKLAIACLMAAAGFAANAALVVQLTNAAQAGHSGTEVTFFGTLSNTAGSDTVWINGDTLTLDSPLALSDVFLDGAPLMLNGGETTAPFAFFSVSVPSGAPAGLYTGMFSVLGGATVDAQDVLGGSSFAVTAVPEPAIVALMGIGLAALLVRRKFSA